MARVIRRAEEKSPTLPPPDQQEYPPHQEELPLEGLRLGDSSRGVATLQLRIGVAATGLFDSATEYVVKQMQGDMKMLATGVADPTFHGRLGLPWPPLDN